MSELPVVLIEVVGVRRLTPHMARVTFTAPELAHRAYDEPDQQVKLYFPKPGRREPLLPDPEAGGDPMRWYESFLAIPEPERPWMRSYTIRAHRPARAEIDIDMVLHSDAGPATRWAFSARPGDVLGVFLPSAFYARPVPLSASMAAADWVLLAGDMTALPAIGTLIESLPDGMPAVAYVDVDEEADEQRFTTRGAVAVHWLHGGDLVAAVRGARFPQGAVFAWLAGEAGTVRALRRHLVAEHGVSKRSIDFAGYWRRALSQDDSPTADDLAEAHERLADAGVGFPGSEHG